jgi:hypothetical protein
MTQSLTVTTIAATSKLVLAALAAHGFKRKSPHLFRHSQDVLHCIHFQSSKWGTSSDGQFTVNLVVTAPALYETWTGHALPANPATASYPIQARIGSCLPTRADTWWTVGPQSSAEVLAGEVSAVIAHHAPAFFSQFPNMQAILSHVRETNGLPGLTRAQAALVRAYLAQLAGEGDEAQALVLAELKAAETSPFRNTIRSFAIRAGIALPQ